ncbi:hypothetical protein N7508_001394 [Penicillium antarcticum]|uniref:uncharacterized protein n=1 Tax=Penicillium antarcticum TaxID=416450 RepID=UPI00239636E8|nr:uncharacterized protein N7508_001394 [Penicillium antarcticum]KAJ5316886.1 hypothetical protein N7508_001394 [Penicillium antarcticum]
MTRGFATITPQCEEVFDQVKETDTLDWVTYKASAHDKKIDVANSGKSKDYADFISNFPENECLYSVYDFQYDSPTGGEKRHKLVFITWYVISYDSDPAWVGRVMSMQLANCSISHPRVPEQAGIHDKTYYTTNKDHLYRAFEGISLHVQAHTPAELAHATILSQFKVL